MERWVEQENVNRFLKLLNEATDPVDIETVQALLADSRAKLAALEERDMGDVQTGSVPEAASFGQPASLGI